MKKIEVSIEGISPLLMHRFAQDTDNIPKSKKKGQKQITDNYEGYLYLDHENKLVQPAGHILGALKIAGGKFQIPSQKKATYRKIIGSGAVIIEPDLILHKYQDWVIDTRAVIVNRGRIMRQRPRLDKWSLSFTVEYDEDEINKPILQEIFDVAGKRIGIGDYRPDKGGPFGKFIITKFE